MNFFFYTPAGFVQDETFELVPEQEDRPRYKDRPEHIIRAEHFNTSMSREHFDRLMASECRRLIAIGRMPSESEFWQSVYEARLKFGPRIRRAQRETREQAQQQRQLFEVN
jgi:hypothetical protein